MSSVLPHDPSPANNQTAPLTETQHDLEFRTITTLLHILGIGERIDLDDFRVSMPQRAHLKLLSALSSLLVRHTEIIAVMPKRSVFGTTLFVCAGVEYTTGQYFPHDESITSRDDSVTRNREIDDPVGPVKLLDSPTVEIGSDIFAFMLQNWEQSFEQHVQSFAYLLNTALANPDDDKARAALDIFSFFQSTRKTYRRFTPRYSPRLHALLDLHPHFTAVHVPSLEDQSTVRALLTVNPNGTKLHPVLHGFLTTPPVDEHHWLPEFHKFFAWFLRMAVKDIKQLAELRARNTRPPLLPENDIERAYNNLAALGYFHGIRSSLRAIFDDVTDATPAESPREDVRGRGPRNDDTEDDMGLDIATEFETGIEQESTATSDHTHPCILELRLASSNTQNINTIFNQAPRCHFRFQVIQYAPAGHSLKPWRNLIQELFPQEEVCKRVVQSLVDTSGRRFDCFRPGGPDLVFTGQAQCAAVLGCLFSLRGRTEDHSWSGIAQSVLQAIGACYNLLAPSKRCCSVCATIVSLLSEEDKEAGGTGMHALSKRSVIVPCALPAGLPKTIRHRLLSKYRNQLRVRLTELMNQSRSLSTQSAALSHDGDESEGKPTGEQKQLLRIYRAGWAVLDQAERRERWGEARQGLAVGQLMTWWEEMSEDVKSGLVPPGKEMRNLSLVSEGQA